MADLRNDFKPFAVNPSSDVMPQNRWDEGLLRKQGHVPGLASQFLANKAERQGTLGAAAIGELITRAGLPAIDDGDPLQLTNALQAAVIYMAQLMLFELIRPTATDGKPVLIGFGPTSDAFFGYPIPELPNPDNLTLPAGPLIINGIEGVTSINGIELPLDIVGTEPVWLEVTET